MSGPVVQPQQVPDLAVLSGWEAARLWYSLSIPSQYRIIRLLGYLDLQKDATNNHQFFLKVFTAARKDGRIEELKQLILEEKVWPVG